VLDRAQQSLALDCLEVPADAGVPADPGLARGSRERGGRRAEQREAQHDDQTHEPTRHRTLSSFRTR
jgi:hypothetical protein